MAVQQLWIPYCGAAPLPTEWLGRWNLDPVLLGLLAAGALVYVWAGRDWGRRSHRAFAIALGLLFLLFVSPICALSSALFSVRVVHHVLLAAAVAPLLAAAFPAARWPRGSLAAWTGGQALLFWLWHAPPLYAWALSSDSAYWLMQASLLGSAFGFWTALRRSPAPAAVVALLATTVQMGLLGALLTFVGRPLYGPHLLTTQPWGFSPLEDQQLAGLIMWAPAAAFYLAAALLLFNRLLRDGTAPSPAL